MRRVDPPQPVLVQRDNTWHEGSLEWWRLGDAGWEAFVAYSVGIGMRHLGWVNTDRVQPR